MELAIQIVMLPVLVESVVETLKLLWKGGKVNGNQILSLVVGLILAFTTNTDILAMLDIPSGVPVVGLILTGILISRGGGFIHDLLGKLERRI